MKINRIAIIIVIIFSSILLYRYFFQQSTERAHEALIIGTASGYAPFVSIDENGNYEGFDIDVAYHLAKEMGKDLVIKDLGSMTSLFIALRQGSIDAIMWGMSITRDRLKKVAMVHYQGGLIASYPLLFWKHIPENIACLSDMHGMTVCVEPGSAQDALLDRYSLIEKKTVEKIDDALLNIQYGKVDAALVEEAIAKKFKNKYSEVQIVAMPLACEDQEHGNGIVIKKENVFLIKEIQQAIDSLKRDGTIKRLEQKWHISS